MAKRFTKPSINWAEMAKLVPPEEKAKFMAFKARSEVYLRKVLANPETPPAIDWEYYKKSVPIPGLVDKLKSAYESFKVPYPTDNLSSKVDEQWQTLKPQISAYCADLEKTIQAANKELDRIESLPKFEDITMEMFYDMYPNQALDPVNKPRFWPNTEDEQLGYVYPEQAAAAKKGH